MPRMPKVIEGQEVEKYPLVENKLRLLLEEHWLDFLPRLSRSMWLWERVCDERYD